MKKLLLILLTGLASLGAKGQTSCSASTTYSQTPNTYAVIFTNTSTHAPTNGTTIVASKSIDLHSGPNGPAGAYISSVYGNSGSITVPSPGIYTAVSSVWYIDSTNFNNNCHDTTWSQVLVTQQPCILSITSVTGTGLTRTFTANNGVATPGSTYSWNFGAGGGSTANGITATHTFPAAGTYTVSVTIVGAGCTNTVSVPVTVSVPLNCSNVSNAFTTTNTANTYSFTPTYTPATYSPTHLWDFGDGVSSSSAGTAAVTHTYPFNGTYAARLVTQWNDSANNVFCADTATQTIVVTGGATFNCANAATSITASVAGSVATLTAGPTPLNTANVTVLNTWSENGSFLANSAGSAPVTYNFPAAGPHTVLLTTRWYITGTNYLLCTKTATQTVTTAVPGVLNCATTNAVLNATAPAPNGDVTFTNASTPTTAPLPGYHRMNYMSFGDGFIYNYPGASTFTITHQYTTAGTFNARLITNWIDSASQAVVCRDTAYQTVVIASPNLNCATVSNSFNTTPFSSGLYVQFQPFVSPNTIPGVTLQNDWVYGDGTSANNTSWAPVNHTYATAGTYTVRLVTRWLANGTNNLLCTDTAYGSVTVGPLNAIFGHVMSDSSQSSSNDTFKVWLITFNAQTNLLTAVDSTVVSGFGGYTPFSFLNKPAGVYRTKAHKLNQAGSGFGYVPTYRDSSLTWGTANTFTHSSGVTQSGGIYLRQGLVTSGPGFVGGSVLSGANKGTADGDPVANQLVFLRDAVNGSLVQSAYTNSAGAYSFSNVPIGVYRVYPEEMNYVTTPSSSFSITAGSASATGLLFKKDDVDRDIKPVSAAGIATTFLPGLVVALTPNPTSGDAVLTVSLPQAARADVQVITVAGRVVHAQTVDAARATTLKVSDLPSGVYTVRVATEVGTATTRLIIAR